MYQTKKTFKISPQKNYYFKEKKMCGIFLSCQVAGGFKPLTSGSIVSAQPICYCRWPRKPTLSLKRSNIFGFKFAPPAV
jgi:hypothetical protein